LVGCSCFTEHGGGSLNENRVAVDRAGRMIVKYCRVDGCEVTWMALGRIGRMGLIWGNEWRITLKLFPQDSGAFFSMIRELGLC
jgi:hypothetical protein